MDARLSSFLAEERVLVRPDAADKWQLIDRLIDAVEASCRSGLEGARAALLDRERQISTGLEQGIALPHGMLPGDFPTLGALGVVPAGVDFEAMDGAPVHFVIMMLFPDTPAGRSLHVGLLAQTLRVFTDPRLRGCLLEARDSAAALAILTDHELSLGM